MLSHNKRSKMTIQASFLNDGSANDGKIRLLFTDDGLGPSGDTTVSWGIIGPLGQDVKAFPIAPDLLVPDGGTQIIYVPIPLNSDGTYMGGSYVFTVEYTDGGTLDIVSLSYSFDYAPVVLPGDPTSGPASLSASFNCLNGKITTQDTSVLPEGSVLTTRLLTVTPPTIAGQPSPVVASTALANLEVDFEWNNAPYQVTLSRLITTTTDFGDMQVLVVERFVATETLTIVCNTDLCDAAACMASEFESLEAEACGGGGWAMLTAKQKAKLEKAMYRTVISMAYRQCGNFNKAAEWAALADTCDCGCGDAATTGPSPYTPPIG